MVVIRYEDLLASLEQKLDTMFDFLELIPKMSTSQITRKPHFDLWLQWKPKMALKKLLHTVNFLGLVKRVSAQLLPKGSERKSKNNLAEQ